MNPAPPQSETLLHCDFCGLAFDAACATEQGCTACPLSAGCTRIICPRCGYQMLPEAGLIRLLRRWAKPRPAAPTALQRGTDETQ